MQKKKKKKKKKKRYACRILTVTEVTRISDRIATSTIGTISCKSGRRSKETNLKVNSKIRQPTCIMYCCTIWADYTHYENTPIQIRVLPPKTENFQIKNADIFHISAQNIDCGYSLGPPRRGGSNEYPQSMFWAEIRKIMYTPVNPRFTV